MKNLLFSFCIFFTLGFSPDAHAEDLDATPIEKGEPAPFSGTLLTNEAAASLLAEIHTCSERAQSDLQFQLDSLQARCDLDSSLSQIRFESNEERYKSIVASQDDQLDYLLRSNTRATMSREVAFIVGIVGGVVITSAAAYSLHSISNSN